MKRVTIAVCAVGCLYLAAGCAALTAAKGGADSAKGAADDAKSQKDSAQAAVKDEKDKAKGGGGGGGETPAGATRLEAGDGEINVPISDKLDTKKGKINDWRKFQLVGRPGIATFVIHWDDEAANLDIDVYDAFGSKIGKSPPRLEGQAEKKILVQIDDPGMYYVKVSAPSKADSSIYTMEVKWKGPSKAQLQAQNAPPPQATTATPPAGGTAAGGAAVPDPNAPPPCPAGQFCPDPNKVYGSIVQMVRENGGVTLYLDKGSSDKIHVGMTGFVIDGADGEKPFEGGSFTISQVVGGGKSIARSTTLQKPLGKNKRVAVNLK